MKKLKIIIADDNTYFCEMLNDYLTNYEDIKVLGIADSNNEIKMIETLKPDIVITDLKRGDKYTGLDIIKRYMNKEYSPKFLVISGDFKKEIIEDGMNVSGYIGKPINDYNKIYTELKRIKNDMISREYEKWSYKYYNIAIFEINKFLRWKDKNILRKLGIRLKNKKYTEFEYDILKQQIYEYYIDNEESEEMIIELKKHIKSYADRGVTDIEFESLIQTIELIDNYVYA